MSITDRIADLRLLFLSVRKWTRNGPIQKPDQQARCCTAGWSGLILILVLFASRPALATFPTGFETISLGVPESFNSSMSIYDGSDETLRVMAFADLDGGSPVDFSVFVQNREATYGGFDVASGRN